MAISRLTPAVHEKVWGSKHTEPWLENPEGRKIGELWYSAPESLPILLKFLFTTERLSVQVHPGDEYARAHGDARGKTEMWHVLRAEPDAEILLGLRETVSKSRLLESADTGEIVGLLNSIPVHAGETFFVPAGSIHAIGGGLAICEIQQLSDLTYRLFDYHRKPERPLHLEDSLAVADLHSSGGRVHPVALGAGRELLAECEFFRTERLVVEGSANQPASATPAIVAAIRGEGRIDGQSFRAGDAWLLPAGWGFHTDSPKAEFVIASYPGAADSAIKK